MALNIRARVGVLLAAMVLGAALPPAAGLGTDPVLAASGRALVLVRNSADLQRVTDDVHQAGGRVAHSFPPRAFITEDAGHLPQDTSIQAVYTQRVGRRAMSSLDASARRAALTWNRILGADPSRPAARLSEDSLTAPVSKAFELPLPWVAVAPAGEDDPTPGYYQTTEFLIGRVAVGIVMSQSDGSIDPSTQQWTREEQDLVVAEITAALDWWAAREPRARLSFVYDDNEGQAIKTSYEPVSRPYGDEHLWITEVMERKGYQGSTYFDQVYAYNNALRDTYATDWAFTVFVVNSSATSDGNFADGFFAYAYRGGPFCVLTSKNGGYGIGHLASTAAHEIGHIFHALDQYAGAGGACTRRAGYLDVENQNSVDGDCLLDQPSIMRSLVEPFAAEAVDPYARGQVGWRDSDGDGILDPVDTTIQLSGFSYVTDTTHSNAFHFIGTVHQTPYPSPTRPTVTINTIETVEYRIGSGPWIPTEPTDGAFDAWQESFHFTTDPLPTGEFSVDIRAQDSWGNSLVRRVTTLSAVDPADDHPRTTLTRLEVENVQAATDTVSYRARAISTVSYIAATYYRVGSHNWELLEPDDGGYGQEEQTFTFSVTEDTLQPGRHRLEIYSVDGEGNVEQPPVSDIFYIQGEGNVVHVFLPLMLRAP